MPAASSLPELSREEVLRYSRHLLLPEVTIEGQQRLKAGRVLLVGTGGLGSPLGLYLGAAGVGTLGLVDYDVVDVTNLHRQVLHGTASVGKSKLESAKERIADINPHVHIETHATRLTAENALDILRGYDVVVDGTDNFATRYLVNDACVLLGKPNVYGSVFRFDGQASVFATDDGPCYRCVYPAPPPLGMVPSCADGGILGVLPGLVGVIQATETIKLLLGRGEPLIGRLLLVDALSMTFRTMTLNRDPACPACGTRTLTELPDYDAFCGVPENDPNTAEVSEISPTQLAARLARSDGIELIDVREDHEWAINRLPGSRLVPLDHITQAMHTLDQTRDVVLYCRNGDRSAAAVTRLKKAGFGRLLSLSGGISRWSDEVDPEMPKY
jgi:adenylyltransferase/sulfurtransferase